MAEEKIILCCGAKIWTRVIGSLQLIGCLLVGCLGSMVIAALGQGQPAEQGGEEAQTALLVVLWAAIVIASLLTVLLLVGNEKERAGFLLPFLVFSYIGVVSSVLGMFGAMGKGDIGSIFGSLAQLALQALFTYAVHQRYKEIKAGVNDSARRNPGGKL